MFYQCQRHKELLDGKNVYEKSCDTVPLSEKIYIPGGGAEERKVSSPVTVMGKILFDDVFLGGGWVFPRSRDERGGVGMGGNTYSSPVLCKTDLFSTQCYKPVDHHAFQRVQLCTSLAFTGTAFIMLALFGTTTYTPSNTRGTAKTLFSIQ